MTSSVIVRSAWREPMLWLVWGLPALVVIAGFATLAIAIGAGGADAVPAAVRRTAQIQVEDLAPDRLARVQGLHGELVLAPDTGAATLVLSADGAIAADQLRLRLSHPSHGGADREVMLTRSGAAWLGRLPVASGHAWNLELEPLDARWRLAGRLPAGRSSAALLPRLRD